MRKRYPLLLMFVFVSFAWVGYSQTFGVFDPFVDHSDTGQTVRVFPPPASIHVPGDTQPTDAPPAKGISVYPASYGSGNLIDHGGPEVSSAGFQAVYWNSSVANSAATSLGYPTIQAQINAFVTHFPDSKDWDNSTTDDYEVIQQYGAPSWIANSLSNFTAYVDNQPTSSSISDSSIEKHLASLFNTGKLSPSSSVIYGVFFPHGMKVTLGGSSCSTFCAYHSHFTYGSYQIKYDVFPYLDCSACSLSGKTVADMLTIAASHEVRETVTDPGDYNLHAWYDPSGYEADDKCAWHNLYQMTNGSFWVQPEYSNGGLTTASNFTATYPGPGCVVPNK